ncbi:MAG TPA: Bax inhibitor-1 family protein [Ktedonobacteraceae bacterium]|nr:Bax inhibitor-1 family protein [Ktedonobacteraceae bacterium]
MNNSSFGRNRNNGMFGGSRYQYQTVSPAYAGTGTSSLIGKVMGLLAVSFLFALLGTIVGGFFVTGIGTYFIVAIAGLIVLIALHAFIQRPGLNLFLLYLFTLLEGMAISPIIGYYLQSSPTILAEAFSLTALTTFALGAYAWTTKRDFSHIGDYLFFGVILLLVASLLGIFFGAIFGTPLVVLIISSFGVAIFSGYVLFYVQRAKYMADTMPNAIGLTVSLFITVLNLFLYILEILSILQGGGGRRR